MQTTPESRQTHDTLGQALRFLRMSGTFYCRSELTAPWGVTVPSMPGHMWFHVVLEGTAWLEVGEGGDRQMLRHGMLVLLPRDCVHRMRSAPDVPTQDVSRLAREKVTESYEVLRYGEGGERTTLFCGAVRFADQLARTLVEALPAAMVIDVSDSPQMDWMQSTLRLIAAEAQALQPGHEAVLTRLGDVLAIQAIRSWIQAYPPVRTGWIAALQDPKIGRAITLIHHDPGRAWTLAEVAREVAMSRSAFAARFSELVGEPMMHYLTSWRMHVALESLRQNGTPVAEVAERLGYRSKAAFSRAFKRVTATPPGAVRRHRSAQLARGANDAAAPAS
jgi:AraC-like DNA-binding protein